MSNNTEMILFVVLIKIPPVCIFRSKKEKPKDTPGNEGGQPMSGLLRQALMQIFWFTGRKPRELYQMTDGKGTARCTVVLRGISPK